MQKDKPKKKAMRGFIIGDKIIDFGQVYRIFKIQKEKSTEDKREKVLYFRPYYKNEHNKDLVCSIPAANIKLTQIRKPASKKKIKHLLGRLAAKRSKNKPPSALQAKEKLKLNSPTITAKTLKMFWLDKQDPLTNFTSNKQDLLELTMSRLVEEVAFVFQIPLAKARRKINHALDKGSKK
ncbi:hypothetical protein ACFLZP_01050 [Patescibacteria group bacterium]